MSEPELEGVALVAACAERIFWKVSTDKLPGYVHIKTEPGAWYIWSPLTNMSDAWQVVDAMAAKGWNLSMTNFEGSWVAGFDCGDTETEEVCDTPGEAILRAALAAIASDTPGSAIPLSSATAEPGSRELPPGGTS